MYIGLHVKYRLFLSDFNVTLGFSYRASSYMLQIRITNRCNFFCTMSLFPFSRLSPTCFGLSWAHHQGYFKLLFLCYNLVHAVLCWLSACVRRRTQTIYKALHEPNGSIKTTAGDTPDDRLMKARNMERKDEEKEIKT